MGRARGGAKRLTNYKIGGLVRFRQSDLDEYLEKAKRQAELPPHYNPPPQSRPTIKRRRNRALVVVFTGRGSRAGRLEVA